MVVLVIFTYNTAEDWGSSAEDASRALRSIWRSIPDPDLCREEFFEVFAGINMDFEKLKSIVEKYAKFVCEDDFQELAAQPRSLTHYSRCKIRQVLKFHKLQLPAAVNKLPVPTHLKNYLLLEY